MIELFYAPTPNVWKVSIMLSECGLPYTPVRIRLEDGQQFEPDFRAINPNSRVPALVDHAPNDGEAPLTLFESGAILLYLARKTGRFFGAATRDEWTITQWLMWQMGGLGPTLGQNGHFKLYAPEPVPYAQARFAAETLRLYAVLEARLEATGGYLSSDYSIADMACFPWIMTHKAQGIDLSAFPAIHRWFEAIRDRPAVQTGLIGLNGRRGSTGGAPLADTDAAPPS